MIEAFNSVKNFCTQYYSDSPLLLLYVMCLIILCFMGKEQRRIMVYPSLLIMLVILNPIFYKLVWARLIKGTYWRMLWMIPVVPVIIYTLITLIGKINKKIISVILLAVFIVFIVSKNTLIYDRGTYVDVNNIYKLPDSTLSICNMLIEAEDGGVVKVIMPSSIYCYARQFDHRIHQMYGRDAENFMGYEILSDEAKNVAYEMSLDQPDMSYVTSIAKQEGYEYIVCELHKQIDDNAMREYGFEVFSTDYGYKTYHNNSY